MKKEQLKRIVDWHTREDKEDNITTCEYCGVVIAEVYTEICICDECWNKYYVTK